MNFLFEVSWDVGNNNGQITRAIEAKAAYAVQAYQNRYFIIGAWRKGSSYFKQAPNNDFPELTSAFEAKGLTCHLGYWDIPARPTTILVDFENRHNPEEILFQYWRDYNVDSITGQWDYIEPVLFGTTCAEVIETVFDFFSQPKDKAIAHIHHWTAGATLLHLKRSTKKIATVFTNYSTVVGKTLAQNGRNIFEELTNVDPNHVATEHGVMAKHSLECACAREADQFTTVSDLTAQESASIIGRKPSRALPVGYGDHTPSNNLEILKQRQQLIQFANRFWGNNFGNSTKLWATVADGDFIPSGFDILIESLANLDRELAKQNEIRIVLLALLPSIPAAVDKNCHDLLYLQNHQQSETTHYTTHSNNNPAVASIINACQKAGLVNLSHNRCFIAIVPTILNGWDGIFNRTYQDLLSACHLATFPALYEPVDHLAVEAAALGVPVILSDLHGWGAELETLPTNDRRGITLLKRHNHERQQIVSDLSEMFLDAAQWDQKKQAALSKSARKTTLNFQTSTLYQEHKNGYKNALARAGKRWGQKNLKIA